MDTVTVAMAFSFECPYCHTETFVHAIPHEFSQEEVEEIEDETGEPVERDAWVTSPSYVTCRDCDREFRALQPGEEPDEDELD